MLPKGVLSIAIWALFGNPKKRKKSRIDQILTSACCPRQSEHIDIKRVAYIVNIVDRRRSSLSRCERPPLSSNVDDTFRQSTYRGEIFLCPELRTKFQRNPYFCRYRYLNFVKTHCRIGRKKPPCQKPARSVQPF